MADTTHDFALLAATAQRSIEDLRRAVRSPSLLKGERGAAFLSVVEAVIDALDAGVAQKRLEFGAAGADDADRRTATRELRGIYYDVMTLHRYTPWVQSAGAGSLDLGIVYLVDVMLAGIVQRRADVVLSPQGTYMYQTIHRPFATPLADLGVTYPTKIAPVIVEYPIHEPDSLFLHLIIAHELGHSAITEHRLDHLALSKSADPAHTGAVLSRAATERSTVEKKTPKAAQEEVNMIFDRWLHEVLCDGLAFGLLGPSLLLTAAVFGMPMGVSTPSESHPPLGLRLRLLIKRAEQWGWRPWMEASFPVLLAWMDEVSRRPQEPRKRLYFLQLEAAVDGIADAISEALVEHLDDKRFLPEHHTTTGIGDEVSAMLALDVLPAQLRDRTPAPARSILLSGWLRAIKKRGDDPAALANIVDDHDFQRFLTRAIEMSVVLERWRQV